MFANLELKQKLESFFAIKPDGEILSQGFSWNSRLKFDWKARLEVEQDKAWARKPGLKLRLNYKQGHYLEKQKKAWSKQKPKCRLSEKMRPAIECLGG